MKFTSRIRFEAVINTTDGYVTTNLEQHIKEFVALIGADCPGSLISASINVSHEKFEQNHEIKGFIPESRDDEIVFGSLSTISEQIINNNDSPTPTQQINSSGFVNNKFFSGGQQQPIEGETITNLTGLQSQIEQEEAIAEPSSEDITKVDLAQNTKELSLLDYPEVAIIDALSRIKEIGEWMDRSRSVTEQIPKIRHEIKDLTKNLLNILGNNKKGSK